MSLPTWECGLKQSPDETYTICDFVTPHVGVWIETTYATLARSRHAVTPHVGVWIETRTTA